MKRTPADRVQAELRRLIGAGVAGGVFPGAAAAVAWREGSTWVYVEEAGGRLAPGEDSVIPGTPYDLASLTKPFTAMTALSLVERGRLRLDSRVRELLPELRSAPVSNATLEQLLNHSSGLAAWGGLYLDVPHEPGSRAAYRWILAEAARRIDETPPGPVVYSDLGYMLAGEAVARAVEVRLSDAIREAVLEPLGLAAELVFPGEVSDDRKAEWARAVPPTEYCRWRDRPVRGEVHDENCFAMGGVSGHAGLFGPARGVAGFGCAMVDAWAGESERWSSELMRYALRDRPGTSYRLGWDCRSGTGSAAGRMGPQTFGHLGFTGTSLWCDPEAPLVVVLLTNRVHPTRANIKIRSFRPSFHDGVVAAFDAKRS